jgi:hypothetical protein
MSTLPTVRAMRSVFRWLLLTRRVCGWPREGYSLQDQSSFKAALNGFVSEERVLDNQEDLADEPRAQIGLYTLI